MHRLLAGLAVSVALAGCGGSSEPAVGVSTAPLDEEESSTPTTGRTEPRPGGGGGVDFDAKEPSVRAKCAAERGKYKHDSDSSSCTIRHEGAGATRLTLAEYCDASVCRVHTVVVLDQPDAKTWLTAFEHLRRELGKNFGAPDEQQIELPADCEQKFSDCVRSGKAKALFRWRWDDGYSVMLRLGSARSVPAAISVSYANPAGTRAE